MKLRKDFWPRLRLNWKWMLRSLVGAAIVLPFAIVEWVLITLGGWFNRAGDAIYDVAFRENGPLERLGNWVGKPAELPVTPDTPGADL